MDKGKKEDIVKKKLNAVKKKVALAGITRGTPCGDIRQPVLYQPYLNSIH